ncbi:MAG: hypothetical protein P4L73_19760 [Caulobacteraceae bacterium]|nr:hypothetical protein [Caulobacteraceae bacterium]
MVAVLLTSLAGCATTSGPSEPQVITRTVEVPVAVQCAVQSPAEPAWADSDVALKAAPDLFARVQLLVAGRLQHYAYEAQQAAELSGCTGQPHP